MEATSRKIGFWTIIFVAALGVGLLFGCGEEPILKFARGDMVQTKVGKQVGQIIDTWRYEKKYTIRFERRKSSENGRLFETDIMGEFELEKFNGKRR